MGDALRIDWRTQPKRTRGDVLRCLRQAKEGPERSWQIGWRLGIFAGRSRHGHGGTNGSWCHGHGRRAWDNANWLQRMLTQLRDEGRAVKLPHELARSEARYGLCDGLADARRQQLAACEALLLTAKTPGQHRTLLTVLDGLRR